MKIVTLIFFLLLPFTTYPQLVGNVVSISDGDTFTMLVNKEQIKIRLHGIDCPEKKQDFGNVAKEFLSSYVFGKVVTVQNMNTDRYGRTIGIVTVDGVNINEKLLEEGLAWHYKTYDKNPEWSRLETDARNNKKGLWVQPNAVSPWDYRKGVR